MTETGRTELGSAEFWKRAEVEPAKLAAEICFIDISVLEEVLQRHAALRAWMLAQHEVARIAEERAKWKLTMEHARALVAAKGTVDERKAQAEIAEPVQAAQEAVFVAQEKRGALRAMADALEDRTQMLIQLSAKQRQEQKDYNR